jgi:SAM-dependent methyltransferase
MTNTRRPSANLSLSRYEWALDRLGSRNASLPSEVVFDIGPGDGRMRKIRQDGFEWRGFDIAPWSDVVKWDLNDSCPVQDCRPVAAFLLDVIEHCVNPGLALQNIGAVMDKGGRLLITTPNPAWSGSRANMLLRGHASSFAPADLEDNHHVLPIWPHVLERMLQYAGFVVDEYVTLDGRTGFFDQPGKKFRPARYLLNAGLIAIEAYDPNACGASSGIVARKVAQDAVPSMHYPGT